MSLAVRSFPSAVTDIDGYKIVAGQAVLPGQPAPAASEGQAGDPGRGDLTAGSRQPEGLGLVIKLPPCHAGVRAGGASGWIDAYGLHPGQVDHQAGGAHCIARDIVTTPTYGENHIMRTGEIDRCDHVGRSRTAGNQCRALVDHAIPDFAGCIVTVVTSTQESTAQTPLELFDNFLAENSFGPRVLDDLHVCHG